jgi:hypothetical protein
MAAGNGFTTTNFVAMQPVPNVYVIVTDPPELPVTIPPASIVAVFVFPLLHVPPDVASLNVTDDPAHTVPMPAIEAGNGLTVTTVVAIQFKPVVYVMFAVPAPAPVMLLVPGATVATERLSLDHTPPATVLLNTVVNPLHTVVTPDIADGVEYIVAESIATQLPASE